MSQTQSTSTSQTRTHTRSADESKRKIDLVGNVCHQITGCQLPSNRQVLQLFFYNIRFVNVKPNAKTGAKLTIDAVLIFWRQARIPTRRIDECIKKLLDLYEKWNFVQKSIPSKRTGMTKQSENEIVESLDDLFDISSADALNCIKIESDRKFLVLQKMKGRPGCMGGVDMTTHHREIRAVERREKEEARKKAHDESMTAEASGK